MPISKPVTCKLCPDGVSTNYCARCRSCKPHHGCECRQCGICNKYHSPKDYCVKCGRCKECHIPGSSFTDEFPLRPCLYISNPAAMKVWTHQINTLRRTLGCEIEIGELAGLSQRNHAPLTPLMPWHLEHDGSVQPSGQELVTGISAGDQYLQGISQLLTLLHNQKCKTNSSCGFHVHVDAADLGYFELRRILVGFMVMLPQVWGSLVAASRATNNYCPAPPISDTALHGLMGLRSQGEIRDWFHKFLYNVGPMDNYSPTEKREVIAQLKQFKAKKYMNTARRMAINFHSWMMRGTIEFRLKEGTLCPADVLMWPLWCGWFVEILGGTTRGGIQQGLTDKEVWHWIDNPPTLTQLARDCMPRHVALWVEERVKSPAPNPSSPSREPVEEIPEREYDLDDEEEEDDEPNF